MKHVILYSILSIALLHIASDGIAQDPFAGKMKRQLTCYDVGYNALQMIPAYYQSGHKDSIIYLVNYWEEKCGTSEFSLRARTLLEIERKVFHEEQIDYAFFDYLIARADFMAWRDLVDSLYVGPGGRQMETLQDSEVIIPFNDFTIRWARQLLAALPGNGYSDIRAILTLYTGREKEFLALLQEKENSGSPLKRLYAEELATYQKINDVDLGLATGVWIPGKEASVLGVHPTLGFYGGLQADKWLFNITMLFRFLKSADPYQVEFEDMLYDTDHFLGGYIGLDLGYQFLGTKRSRSYLVTGVAWDGFDALKDKDDEDFSKSINSLNLNVGLGHRYFLNDQVYIGLQARYNFVNYKNNGGTDLSGNTQTIRLLIGFMGHIRKANGFKRLRYGR